MHLKRVHETSTGSKSTTSTFLMKNLHMHTSSRNNHFHILEAILILLVDIKLTLKEYALRNGNGVLKLKSYHL